jgi:uncharacterized membrane protein YccF (DUF307 family)
MIATLRIEAPGKSQHVRLLLNIIWFVLAGLWIAFGYTLAALICFILIVTIPFGIASLRIAVFALWPFGKTLVKRADAGLAAGIGNVIWFLLCGWWLAIAHLISGVLLCLTIIGIPLGLANLKLIPVSLFPMGREIVSIEEARALGIQPMFAPNGTSRPERSRQRARLPLRRAVASAGTLAQAKVASPCFDDPGCITLPHAPPHRLRGARSTRRLTSTWHSDRSVLFRSRSTRPCGTSRLVELSVEQAISRCTHLHRIPLLTPPARCA